jgi:hypothetical protein
MVAVEVGMFRARMQQLTKSKVMEIREVFRRVVSQILWPQGRQCIVHVRYYSGGVVDAEIENW